MADLDSILHLPCFLDALLSSRHPLATARDVAALALAGVGRGGGLARAWRRVAEDLEAACCESRFPPTFEGKPVLDDPSKLTTLRAPQLRDVARAMDVQYTTMADTIVAVVERHHHNLAACTCALSPGHKEMWDALRRCTLTTTDAMKQWKLKRWELDQLECELLDNPHGGSHPMRLYMLADVVGATRKEWIPDRRRSIVPPHRYTGTRLVRCPDPCGTTRRAWKTLEDVRAVVLQKQLEKQKKEELEKQRAMEAERVMNEQRREGLRRRMDEPTWAALNDMVAALDPSDPRCPVCHKSPKRNTVIGVMEHIWNAHILMQRTARIAEMLSSNGTRTCPVCGKSTKSGTAQSIAIHIWHHHPSVFTSLTSSSSGHMAQLQSQLP